MTAFSTIRSTAPSTELNAAVSDSTAGFISTTGECVCETTARKALKSLRSSKEWGGALSISPQQVNRWANGERIPTKRQREIVRVAKWYLLSQQALEDEIDRMLLMQFGPARDPGRF